MTPRPSLIAALRAERDSAVAEERVARGDEAAAYFNGKVTAFQQAIELVEEDDGKCGSALYVD